VSSEQLNLEQLKARAAFKAVEHLDSGMVIGLGTGSTAKYAIEAIGKKWQTGELKDIIGVATSKASEAQAKSLGIPLKELDASGIDVAIDGMDEVTDDLQAIKGLGGALTREKIVESRARTLILIADESKRVSYLGQKAPIPVEIIPFGYQSILADLSKLTARAQLRHHQGHVFITDNHNYIVDCYMQGPFDSASFVSELDKISGVVEHGLFLNMAKLAYIATSQGVVTLMRS